MFIVMSLHTVNFPFAANEFRLREMLKDFVVPSLIVTGESNASPLGGEGALSTVSDGRTSVRPGSVERYTLNRSSKTKGWMLPATTLPKSRCNGLITTLRSSGFTALGAAKAR